MITPGMPNAGCAAPHMQLLFAELFLKTLPDQLRKSRAETPVAGDELASLIRETGRAALRSTGTTVEERKAEALLDLFDLPHPTR